MSTISQSIPNFLSGISQQPDNRKRPGQVRDAVNAFPDFALGMLKRPGGEFVSKLYDANPSTTSKWFEILRDDNEKYIAQFADNVFRVWHLKDGLLGKVDMQVGGTGGNYNFATLQADADALNTATKTVGTDLGNLKDKADVVDEKTTGLTPTFTELFETTTTYSVEVEETLHSGVILNKDGVYLVKDNETVISNTTSMPANYQLGVERTAENLLLASKGYRVFSVEKETAPVATAQADLTAAETAYATAKTTYDTAVTDANTYRTTYDGAASNNAIATATGYLAGATADDIELLTLNDTTFVLNKKKDVAFTANTTHNGTISPYQAHVTIVITSTTGNYSVTIDGTKSSASGSGATSALDIAAALATDINLNTSATAVQVGPGVHISNSTAFDISVGSDTGADAMTLITNKTNNTSRLPLHTMNGYVLQVVNSEEVAIDDMYLEFKTDDENATKGVGQWFETTKPGISDELDPATMPHVLVSTGNGNFEYKQYDDWKKRKVGDNETNPKPSFVGFPIEHMFFYRNRMGFISGQNVILSKAGDLDNFWNTTAQAATDDDPIDISVGGKKPIFLHYVQPTSVGLVLYSTYEQFLLTTDSDILSPRSAKVNTMSNYECDPKVEAVSLGISHAFISKTPLYTRLFELLEISGDSPPLMADITNYVPELIPQSVDSLKVSTALNIVSLGENGKSDLYQYRFLNRSRDERVVNSWYKWQLAGTLLYQFFDASTLYAVVTDGTNVYVQSFDVAQSNEEGFLTLPTGEKTDVCLDMFNVNPHRTYNAATDKTTIELPYDVIPNKTFTVLTLGDISSVQYPTVNTTTSGSHTAELDGDLRGKNLIIGFLYDMTVDLPTLYKYRQSGDNNIINDDVSSLIIHRLKVKTGLSGPVDYKINIKGIDSWTDTVTVTMPNEYNLNNVNMQASATHVVPVFQRTENLSIQIVGNTPFPVSLLGLDWEGKFNQRFYRRG